MAWATTTVFERVERSLPPLTRRYAENGASQSVWRAATRVERNEGKLEQRFENLEFLVLVDRLRLHARVYDLMEQVRV